MGGMVPLKGGIVVGETDESARLAHLKSRPVGRRAGRR